MASSNPKGSKGINLNMSFGFGKTQAYAALVNALMPSPASEREWRLTVWKHILSVADEDGLVEPGVLRAVGAYGGQQGIWVDKRRTAAIDPAGIAVALKHTGLHYPDELNGAEMVYHYPVTNRQGQDKAEVNAAKKAAELGVPVFVIVEVGQLRRVHLGWIAGWEDKSKQFLVSLGEQQPEKILDRDRSEEEPFVLDGNRSHHRKTSVKVRPDQGRFKLQVFQRYGVKCPFTDITVPAMIEAAHLKPDANGGSSDPRNGLPMNAALHRAFDANLFAVNPDTFLVETLPGGPSLEELRIIQPKFILSPLPHDEALRWRYESWRQTWQA